MAEVVLFDLSMQVAESTRGVWGKGTQRKGIQPEAAPQGEGLEGSK